jgi:type IV pilus assembly protein PilM
MAIQPGVWGIDLGQCALKALRLEVQEDGQVTATAFDYVEHPKILSQPDADPDQLTREALEKFLSRNSLKGDVVAISVPGQSGLARFVKLPPVEEKKISDIVKFEAKQQIPFNLDEVVWDYQKVSSGVVTDGFALETEIGLFAMKRDMVNRYLQHFKDVNVEVHVVQMAPLCLCNYVAYDLLNVGADTAAPEAAGRKHCVVALDIGADSSNLVVTDGARIIWQRPIPLGGNHFTRALTKDLKLTFAKAEHLKRNATKSGPELKKILTALKPVLNDFAGEVQRSLGYFTNTHRDAQVEYMVGLGSAFRLPGLQRFLSEKLQLDVRKLQKFERVAGDPVITAPAFTENVLSFAVAYGLAIQGLHVARLHTNLLPPEIRVERLVRAKKPWAAAAAAALLLGFSGLAWSYALEFRAVDVDHDPLKSAMGQAKGAVDLVNTKLGAFKKEKEEADKEEKAVRSIIAGHDEKLNWIQLNRFLADVLPRPDGKNLPRTRDAQSYWTANAANAQKKYYDQLTHPRPGQPLDTSDVDADLIQFNIESVDARFTDDLAGYWATVKKELGENERHRVKPESDWNNAPKEKDAGWVVELRGYTFHRAGEGIIRDVLVEQLADAGASPTPPAGAAAKPDPSQPVVGRVSHVVLFRADHTGTLLDNGFVAALTGGGGTGGGGMGGMGSSGMMRSGSSGSGGTSPAGGGSSGSGGMGMGGMGGGTKSGRENWVPLISSSAGSLGSGGGGGGAAGGRGSGGPTAPSLPGIGGGGGSGTPPAGGKPPADEHKPGGQLTRTDFVVLFIWKENTPSDALRPTEVIKVEASGGGAGGPMGMSGGASGGASPPASGGGGKKEDE